MDKKDLRRVWEAFTEGNDFMLNPDSKHIDMIMEGVLKNEKKHGLKLCPCRLGDGTPGKELELLCPCNFKTHQTWASKGRCFCGLFVKRQ